MSHATQPVAVCTELIFYALVVAYVGEYGIEKPHFRFGVHRDQKSRLQHDLEEAYCFQRNALASSIGA